MCSTAIARRDAADAAGVSDPRLGLSFQERAHDRFGAVVKARDAAMTVEGSVAETVKVIDVDGAPHRFWILDFGFWIGGSGSGVDEERWKLDVQAEDRRVNAVADKG